MAEICIADRLVADIAIVDKRREVNGCDTHFEGVMQVVEECVFGGFDVRSIDR